MNTPRDLRDILPKPRWLVGGPAPIVDGLPAGSTHAHEMAAWVAGEPAFATAFDTGRITRAEIAVVFDTIAQLHKENTLLNADIRSTSDIKAGLKKNGFRLAAKGIGLGADARKGKRRLSEFHLLIYTLCTATKLMMGNREFGAWSGDRDGDGGPLARLTHRFIREYFCPENFSDLPGRDTFDKAFKDWQRGGLARE